MSSVAKFFAGIGLVCLANSVAARDLHVLVIGDQSAGNCHVNAYSGVPGVFQLDINGKERPAADPLIGADCRAGSIWMPLAALLKQQPGIEKVVLVPVAVVDVTSQDWMSGVAGSRLSAALDAANARGIRFNYALWQQGSRDRLRSNTTDIRQILKVIKNATIRADIDKWLIADNGGSTAHSNVGYGKVEIKFKDDVVRRRYLGPTDAGLSEAERLPNGQLTARGQEKMAQRWFDAIQRADRLNNYYQKESLLYFFR
jgi:hypothetical protein